MPLANYGAANPAATDPWPIETSLAQQANTSPAMAQSMLLTYQMQRQADANRSGQELDQQHQFARDQQKQQLYEALLKAAPEYAGKPGGAALFAALPGSAGLGATPGALGNFAQAGAVNDAATNFQHAAAGLASASEGGVQYDPRYVTGLPNANILSIGPNARVQQAQVNEAGRMGAAAITAAGGGTNQPESVQVTYPYPATIHRAPKETDEAWAARLAAHGVVRQGQPAPNRPLPGGAGGVNTPGTTTTPDYGNVPNPLMGGVAQNDVTPVAGDANPPPAKSVTNLTPAPTGQVTTGAPANAEAGKAAAQQAVLSKMDELRTKLPTPLLKRLVDGMRANGGKPMLYANPNLPGGWGIAGPDGKPL